MPAFLEKKLKSEYPSDPTAPYKVMNAIGAMKGNKTTPKGEAMQKKHNDDVKKKVGMAGRMNALIAKK